MKLYSLFVIFLLIYQLSQKKSREFAFVTSLTVLMWTFSAYFEQILWDFEVALGFTLLTILAYCRYIDSNRQSGLYFAGSIIFYLIALSTYTLQSGAIIAICVIAIFRKPLGVFNNKVKFVIGIFDTACFMAIFIIWSIQENKMERPSLREEYLRVLTVLPII